MAPSCGVRPARPDMHWRRITSGIFALLFSVALFGQDSDHPNFTGIWKLDAHRSTFHQAPPESATLYIHQHDPDFHLRQTEVQHGKSSAWSVHGRTDGKTLDFKSREGTKRTHMYWQGSQLVLEWLSKDKHGETQRTYRYTLSEDGKTLVASDHENKWVFYKSG